MPIEDIRTIWDEKNKRRFYLVNDLIEYVSKNMCYPNLDLETLTAHLNSNEIDIAEITRTIQVNKVYKMYTDILGAVYILETLIKNYENTIITNIINYDLKNKENKKEIKKHNPSELSEFDKALLKVAKSPKKPRPTRKK